jgi:3-oxoacyl-[acyl-carrier-protein] synthase II
MPSGIAVVGMEVITALGSGTSWVWEQMMGNVSGIKPLQRFPHGVYQSDWAGEISGEDLASYGCESGHQNFSLAWCLAFQAGKRALEQAFAGTTAIADHKIGLVLATTKGDLPEFERLVREGGEPGQGLFNPYVLARELSGKLHLRGPFLAVSGACATGLFAIMHGARLLRRGAAEAVLIIGVDVLSDFVLRGFSCVSALDPQPCRPYDAGRAGLSLGEGAGAIVLAPRGRLPARELAAIRGWGVANDARHITAPSKTANGLIQALRQTLAMGGLPEGEVHYINGHGTGTPYNDAMEARAIAGVFDATRPPVSSMKGYFGHTLGAAGVIEGALTVMALQRRMAPASLGLKHPGADAPINLVQQPLELANFKNALTIKSGFGGINAVIALSAIEAHG